MKRKKRDKRVPINSAIKPILKRRIREIGKGNNIFLSIQETGKKFDSIQNSFNGILKKAKLDGKPGVDKIRFHDLRHTAATKLARAGKDMKFIAQYLGHADVRTSARYVHYSDADLKKALKFWLKSHQISQHQKCNPRKSIAPVAQLDRVPDYESVGRRFESCRARQ